ncbi:MAG TPA: response regulator, partial [Bryobacteraceae bacterium]
MNQDNSHKARILVIEDNPADVELLRMALRHAGLDCELTIIDDGADALALVSRQPPASAADLDLAIIDLNLPKHGGEEILEALRANPDLTDLPV